jgi:protein TonB
VKRWLGFGISLLVALSVHAVILLVPCVAGREDAAEHPIEVSLALEPADRVSEVPRPLAAQKESPARALPAAPAPVPAGPAAVPVAPSQPAPAAPQPALFPEQTAAAADPTPGVSLTESSVASGRVETAAGSSPDGTGSTGAPAVPAMASSAPVGTGTRIDSGGAGSSGVDEAGGSAVSIPRPLGEILPEYPRMARRAGWEGVVTIRAVVDETGKVTSAEILISSGHSSLDRAALETVKRWPFAPARRGGKPVSSTVDQPVRFTLN